MTNEQAIQELLSHLEHWERLKTEHIAPVDEATSTIDALLMAIKALSEPSGDLISRADAIRWVKTECNQYGKPTLEFESGKRVIEHLKQMPSAVCDDCIWHVCNYNKVDWDTPSAEAVQGEWIEVEVLPEVYDIEGVKTWGSEMQCDQCGFRHTAIEGRMAQYNFCPNCGARMKDGDDE